MAAFVKQFIRGVEENGGLATAKHFPGHGDVSTDSHLGMPTVPGRPAAAGNRRSWCRSAAAIEAGASSIMTGHLSVPASRAGYYRTRHAVREYFDRPAAKRIGIRRAGGD